jgi:hypothetical protein
MSEQTVDLSNVNLNLNDVSVGITPGDHVGKVTDAKVIKTKKKDAPEGVMAYQLVITYRSNEGDSVSEFKKLGISEWPGEGIKPDDDHETSRKWLKSRLVNLGVREEDCDTVIKSVGQLIGTPVQFSIKMNGEYTNVSFVKLYQDDASVGQILSGNGQPAAAPAQPTGLSF